MLDLTPDRTALLLIDVQQRLLPVIHDHERILAANQRLVDGLNLLEVPVIVTEQYRRLLGGTVPELAGRLDPLEPVAKMSFDCCGEPAFNDALERTGRDQVVIAGIESHVCVLQTARSLAEAGKQVTLVEDACGSRNPNDHRLAAELMRQLGVTIATVEIVLFQLVGGADHADYKSMLRLLK